MLYLCLDCQFIPLSGMQFYTEVWFELLYLHPLWLLLVFPELILSVLYLLLVWNNILTSVMATPAFAKLDFRHVLPMSGKGKIDRLASRTRCCSKETYLYSLVISNAGFPDFTCYGIVCYIVFCAVSRYNGRWYTDVGIILQTRRWYNMPHIIG